MKESKQHIEAIKKALDLEVSDHEKIEIIDGITSNYRSVIYQSSKKTAEELITSPASPDKSD